MDGYSTEDEQVELLKKWWGDNGKSAIFGVVVGLAAIFGWREWQANTLIQIEAASEIYQQALTASGQDKGQEAKDKATEVVNNYGNTGYAEFARLLLANLAAKEGDYITAEKHLSDVLNGISNESLKHDITARLARVYIADNKADQALALLADKGQYGAFAPVYHELQGDAYASQNKLDEARKAYEQAVTEFQGSTTSDVSLLNLKLESLGK